MINSKTYNINRDAVITLALQRRLAWIWTVATTVALFWLFHARAFDDPFITYRYAENLAKGNGFVYNIGERVLSTTTPLYTMLLAIVHLLGADVPTASNLLGCLCIAAGGLALWKLGKTWETPSAGVVGLVLYPTFPLLIPTLGAETAWYVALILFGVLAYARAQYGLTAVLLAFAAVTRGDGILVAAVVAGHFLFARRSRIPWRAVATYVVIVGSWFVFAWLYFGEPLPVTLAAKQRQGVMTISTGFWAGLGRQAREYWSMPLFRIHFALAGIGLAYALYRKRNWLLLLGWGMLYVAAYTMLGVTSYFWYYGPLAPVVIAFVALGVEAVCRALRSTTTHWWVFAVPAVLTAVLLLVHLRRLDAMSDWRDNRMTIYREAGIWLHNNTPPNASVGTLEVGIIGYYADRRMVDFAGLIQPETARQMTSTTTYEHTTWWAIHQYRPSYLVLQRGLFPRAETDPIVQEACTEIHTLHDAKYPFPLSVWQCDWRDKAGPMD